MTLKGFNKEPACFMKKILRFIKIFRKILKVNFTVYIKHNKYKFLLKLIRNLFLSYSDNSKNIGKQLKNILEELGPIFVKFGQLLSTRHDMLSPEIIEELSILQDKVKPFAFVEVKKIIESDLDESIENIFSNFKEEPVASASVAQVHYAELKDNRKVAVKVLRPNMKKQIDLDLNLLEFFASIAEFILKDGKRLKPREIVNEFRKHLYNELDLTIEAANCSQIRRNFLNTDIIKIPENYWEYCSQNVLVMERLEGMSISDIENLKNNNINLKKLAEDGVDIFFTQVFRDGIFHADMHPGNIKVSNDGKYIALDFGIVGSLDEVDKYYLARNFMAFFKRDYKDVAQAHVDSGWVPKNTNIIDFETSIRAVCEPIFDKPLKEISFGKLLLNLFRTARKYNVVIQPQLILLQKTLFNVEGMGRRLYPDLDLWKTAKPNLEKWVSKEVGFKKIFSEFKKELPDIVKDFPKLPRLFKNFLQNSREFDSRKFFIFEKTNKLNNKINFICFLNLILTLGLLLIFYFVIA